MSSRSSTRRAICRTWRSSISDAECTAVDGRRPPMRSARMALLIGARGVRSSCASMARNSFLRRSASDRSAARRAQVVFEPLALGHVLADCRECRRPSGSIRQRQHLVGHPARVAGLEMPEADLDLAVALFKDRRKELVHDSCVDLPGRRTTRPACGGPARGCRARPSSSPARLTKNGTPSRSHMPMKSVLVSTSADELLAVGFGTLAVGDVAHDFRRADDTCPRRLSSARS